MSLTKLLRFNGVSLRHSSVDAWMNAHTDVLGDMAKKWFDAMRSCGADVREVLHDGHPTACVDDAGFAYVNAFTNHVNVGFFKGEQLADPAALLEGSGKFMRHVKLRPDKSTDEEALVALIQAAYEDMKQRVAGESSAIS